MRSRKGLGRIERGQRRGLRGLAMGRAVGAAGCAEPGASLWILLSLDSAGSARAMGWGGLQKGTGGVPTARKCCPGGPVQAMGSLGTADVSPRAM